MPKVNKHRLRYVERAALALVPTPKPIAMFLSVGQETIIEELEAAGIAIEASRFCLLRQGDARMFAMLDLSDRLADGVTLAIAVRSSRQRFRLLNCAISQMFLGARHKGKASSQNFSAISFTNYEF